MSDKLTHNLIIWLGIGLSVIGVIVEIVRSDDGVHGSGLVIALLGLAKIAIGAMLQSLKSQSDSAGGSQ